MRRSQAIGFSLLVAFLTSRNVSGLTIPGKVVETNSGPVEGVTMRSRLRREYYAWLGVPYGKPPIGNLRFAPPEPQGRWRGVLQATHYAPRCAQYDAIQDFIAGREDCLVLNIFAPKQVTDESAKRKVPVMVWLHGGGFIFGTTNDYRANYFMDEDVVLILVNYRLAALGFLNTGDDAARGNMGLKDQSLALRWIRDNVGNFGGDKERVTIFGESAGGSSVQYHMISPMSRGLFQRAISQSGVATSLFSFNDDPVSQAKHYAKEMGCPSDNGKAMVRCLRAKPLREILEYHRRTASIWYHPEHRRTEHMFRASVETVRDNNTFLSQHPEELLREGKFAKIPWMTGVNSAEGLVWMHPFFTNATFRRELQQNWANYSVYELLLNPEERHASEAIRDYYLGRGTDLTSLDSIPKYARLLSDRWFDIPMYKALNLHAARAPAYAYYYSKMGPSAADLYKLVGNRFHRLAEILMARLQDWFMSDILRRPRQKYGADHTDEALMLFPYFPVYNIRPGHPCFEFSKDFVKLWVDFASNRTLEFRNVTFSQFQPGDDPYFFELNDKPGLMQLHMKERQQFWDSITNFI